MKQYGLYDVKDYEQCVYFGTIKEIADYLNLERSSIRSYLSRRKKDIFLLLDNRYQLVEFLEDEEETESGKKKVDKEIFIEILKEFTEKTIECSFKEELLKFKVFDEFKWTLKGLKNLVMEKDEEWKQIPQTNYSISNYGRTRNDKTKQIKSARVKNYMVVVDIYKNGKRYTINVPRTEVNLFIRPLKSNERIIHIDGDSRNNFIENLKIISK